MSNSKIRDTFVLDEDCLDILKSTNNKSEFVREAIKQKHWNKEARPKVILEI